MKKFFFFAAGVFFTSYGLTFIIIYLNLLNMGYTLFGYIKYILTHFLLFCHVIFGFFRFILGLSP